MTQFKIMNPKSKQPQALAAFKKQSPDHPIFKAIDTANALRTALRKARKKSASK